MGRAASSVAASGYHLVPLRDLNYLLPDILWRIMRLYYRLSPVQIYDISFDIWYTTRTATALH